MDNDVTRPVAVLYATREGHTRRIAERIADVLKRHGLAVVAADVRANGADIDLAACAAAVLAASVHMGRFEPEMVRFARTHGAVLRAMPNAFVAVSMSQATVERKEAGDEERERSRAYVRACVDKFVGETGWRADRTVPVAGALRYSQYNVVVRWVMKSMARRAGASTDTTRDHDYTDWSAVDRLAGEFADGVAPLSRPGARRAGSLEAGAAS